jgi:hypothetical protein
VRLVTVGKVEAHLDQSVAARRHLRLKRRRCLAEIVERDEEKEPGESCVDRHRDARSERVESIATNLKEQVLGARRDIEHVAEERMPFGSAILASGIRLPPELPDSRIERRRAVGCRYLVEPHPGLPPARTKAYRTDLEKVELPRSGKSVGSGWTNETSSRHRTIPPVGRCVRP